MKKSIFIIGGAVIIVCALVAAWVYVMFIGTPRTLPEFALFPGGSDADITDLSATTTTPTTPPPGERATRQLEQLTTGPVIGYRELSAVGTSSDRFLVYAEAGTGHIYQINLATREEVRLSGTTIIEAASARFSSDGTYVVYRSGFNRSGRSLVGTVDRDREQVTLRDLPDLADNVHIEGAETLFYSVRGNQAIAKARNLRTGATETLFTVPIADPVILWGRGVSANHIVFPKPSYLLEGFVYVQRRGARPERLPVSGFGLSAARSGELALISTTDLTAGRYETTLVDLRDQSVFGGIGVYMPEKCVGSLRTSGSFWCAEGSAEVPLEFPDSWHRGDLLNADVIAELVIGTSTTLITPLVDLEEESGRLVDGIEYQVNELEDRLYFINRIDNTLWTYDLTP
jgi:hypothetical protein